MKSRNLSLLASACLLTMLGGCGGGGDDDAQVHAAADASNAAPASERPIAATELPGLADEVATALLTAKSEQAVAAYGQVTEPVVEPQRRSADGEWVFGGVYLPIPPHVADASPVNALFVAHRLATGWQVWLEDAAGFSEAMQGAAELTSDEERRVFANRATGMQSRLDASALAVGQDTGLSLPYRRNDPSWGTWGVHGDGGATRPFNAIDFMAGDGRVLASRGGVAYKFCTNGRWPYIKIVHDNGYTTGYYHLRNQPSIGNGQRVAEGDFLGAIGVELPCGGSANGDHVHWTLWRGDTNGRPEPVNGKLIGGWTWYETSQAYAGYAERSGQRVQSGSRGLVNYGHGGVVPPSAPTPTSPVPTAPTSPCSGVGCKLYNGSIGSAGQFVTHPGNAGFQHGGGTLKGWLKGPPGANFDLILGKYNPQTRQWDRAAVSEGASSEESVSHDAPAGTYRWRVSGISGRGAYSLWTRQ